MTANNKTPSAQKQKILLAARKLFYDNGYKNTYFDQIAEICGITKPLISYYFKSKSALSREVTEIYTREIKNTISFRLYKYFYELDFERYDLQVSTAVEIKIMDRLYLSDDKAMRFLTEKANDNYEDLFPPNNKPFFEIHDRRYRLDINRETDELSMISRAASACSVGLAIGYANGEFNCTYEQFSDYSAGLHFRLMRIGDDRIEEIISQSNEIIKNIDFEFLPYFTVR